jgi:hypothetical protein
VPIAKCKNVGWSKSELPSDSDEPDLAVGHQPPARAEAHLQDRAELSERQEGLDILTLNRCQREHAAIKRRQPRGRGGPRPGIAPIVAVPDATTPGCTQGSSANAWEGVLAGAVVQVFI